MDKSHFLVLYETAKKTSSYNRHPYSHNHRSDQPHYRLLLPNLSHQIIWRGRDGNLPALKSRTGTFLFPHGGRLSNCNLQIRGGTHYREKNFFIPASFGGFKHFSPPLIPLYRSNLFRIGFYRHPFITGTTDSPLVAYPCLFRSFKCRPLLYQRLFLRT